MSHFTCAALSPQELAHHLRETLNSGDFPFSIDDFGGTKPKRYHPRLMSAANIPGGECAYIPDVRGSSYTACDFDYFVAYISAHPAHRMLAKYGGINAGTLLILGTKQILDVHGNPFFPLAWYTKERGDRPPTIHALRDLGSLNPEASCLLLYREP